MDSTTVRQSGDTISKYRCKIRTMPRWLVVLGLLITIASRPMAGPVGWTWSSGSPAVATFADYGTMGVASASNSPGGRLSSATWTDASGNLWLFGGWLQTPDNDIVLTNDVWMFNRASGLWTWKAGKKTSENAGVYGPKGQASADYCPGSRHSATAWIDASGKVWIFGGIGYGVSGLADPLNDLWRYDPAAGTWAWMGGSKSAGALGDYGTMGAPAPGNMPGARSSAGGWTDASGNLWLFGGEGYSTSNARGSLGDLWKYNISSGVWTWVKGTTVVDAVAVTGTQGSADPDNMPGGVSAPMTWQSANSLWFYGGYGKVAGGYGDYASWLNDLWKYDLGTGNWTWMKGTNETGAAGVYGTKGEANAANRPGCRVEGATWTDSAGNLWFHGGFGAADLDTKSRADTWKYTLANNQWTWMGGSKEANVKPVFGTKGTPAAGNTAGARSSVQSWQLPDGNGALYSGSTFNYDGSELVAPDMWGFNSASNQWTWVAGPQIGLESPVYGTKGSASAANMPGARTGAITLDAPNGDLWMLGGEGIDSVRNMGLLNDLWRLDPVSGHWTWVNGSNTEGDAGRYGTAGNPNTANRLPGRKNAVAWADNSGNIWVFGGYAVRLISGNHSDILRNDLWKINPSTGQYTWMTGGQFNQDKGVYGTMGQPEAANTPGARESAVSWKDNSGNLWLFGGWGATASSTSPGRLNDLWKYNPTTNQWTWMHGSNGSAAYGVYGTLGTPATDNTPGRRRDAVSWTDKAGNFWLFGGEGYGESGYVGQLNDLWKYDPALGQWAWIAGSKVTDQQPVYGTAGEAAPLNTPGGRYHSVSLIDADGNLWLFGGKGPTADSTFDWALDEVWKFDMASKQWAWMYGSKAHNTAPDYGTRGNYAATNTPGGRFDAAAWSGDGSTFWVFSGGGRNTPAATDLWKFSTGTGPTRAADWQLFE